MSTYDKLWEFQKEDVDKLKGEFSRLIASEMGSGKTFEGLALDEINSGSKDLTLVVSPMTVRPMWVDYFHSAGIDAMMVDPKDRAGSVRQFKRMVASGGGAFMVHWEALRLMPELQEFKWNHIIGDEIHKIQNRKSQQTQALKKIKAVYKTGLSGTPVTGNPAGFWSVLNWLWPKEFRSFWKYHEKFVETEVVYPYGYTKVIGPKNERELLEAIGPAYVRHLKKEQCCPHHPNGVMQWLPDKYYTTEFVELHPKQRKAYDLMKKEMVAWVGEHEDTPLVANAVVSQLMRLQQFSGAFGEISDGKLYLSEPSAKIDRCMEIIEDTDHPIVVFSGFSQMIDLLAARLKKANISHGIYTGQRDSVRTRDDAKQRFANGEIKVFAGTIQAGGVGVDGLQNAANTVIFLDRVWSPAINNQAEDRLWRGGQKESVHVIDILGKDTVDLGRRQRLEMVWDWVKRLLGDKVDQLNA